MPIRFKCTCGKAFKIAEKFAGKKAKCPGCGLSVVVPSPQQLEPEVELGPDHTLAPGPLEIEPPAAPQAQPGPNIEPQPESPPPSAAPAGGAPIDLSLDDLSGDGQAPAPPTQPPVPESVPIDAPAAEPPPAAGAAAESKCPKCGAAAASDAKICVECGTKLEAAPTPAKAAAKGGAKGGGKSKKTLIIIAVAALFLLSVIGALIIFGTKWFSSGGDEDPSPPTAGAPGPQDRQPPRGPDAGRDGPRQPGTPGRTTKKKPGRPKPTAQEVAWSGFSDPAIQSRDKLVEIGQKLLAAHRENGQWPADLREIGLSAEAAGEITYLGAKGARLKRFRALAYQTPSDDAAQISVLFSDGTVRPVARGDLDAVLLEKTPDGWLTGADRPLLAQLDPQLHVSNHRFPTLALSVDGQHVGDVARGADKTFQIGPGAHKVELKAGDIGTTVIDGTYTAGLTYNYTYSKHQARALVPIRLYKIALTKADLGYTAEKEDGGVRSLKGPNETVQFPAGGARAALGRSGRAMHGRIVRGDFTLEGHDGRPMKVDALSRLEDGIIRHKNGREARCRPTPLGALMSEERPTTRMASRARFPKPEVPAEDYDRRPGDMGPRLRRDGPPEERARRGRGPGRRPRGATGRRTSSRPGRRDAGRRGRGQEAPDEPLTVPDLTHYPSPDCQALSPLLGERASTAVPLLLKRATALAAGSAEDGRTGGRGGGRGSRGGRGGGRGGRDRDWAPDRGREPGRGAGSRGRGGSANRWDVGSLRLEPTLPGTALEPETLFAALAIYGEGPSALRTLSSISSAFSPDDPGHSEFLLALAHCGREAALAHIGIATEDAPEAAAIALALIDDVGARNTLGKVVATWPAERIADTVKAWPQVAGHRSRRVFIEAIAESNPEALDETQALNALLKLEPYALEQVLLGRLVATVDKDKATAPEKTAKTKKKKVAGKGRRGGDDRAGPPDRGPERRDRPPELGDPGWRRDEPDNVISPRRGGSGRRRGQARGEGQARPSWLLLGRLRNTRAIGLFVKLSQTGKATEKRDAVAALGEAVDTGLAGVLAPRLGDRDSEVRLAAVKALVAIGDAAAVRELRDRMTAGTLFAVVPKSAPVLAEKVGADTTADLLARMLELSVQGGPKASSGKKGARGRGRDRDGPPPGGPGDRRDEPPPPSRSGGRGRGRGARRTARLERPEEDPIVASPSRLLDALVALKTTTPAVEAALDKALEAKDPWARGDAYLAKAALSPGVAKGPLLEQALKDSHAGVRAKGLKLLAGSPAAEAAPVLEKAVKDADVEIRAAALDAVALIEGKDARISRVIATGLADKEPDVLMAAARAMGAYKDPALGANVVSAMNALGDDRAIEAEVLPVLVEAVASAGAQSAVSSILQLLNHKESPVRVATAKALGKLSDDMAIVALAGALNDRDEEVAAAALRALSQLDSSDAVGAMKTKLRERNVAGELRFNILTLMIHGCAKPGAYSQWARTGDFSNADLDVVAEIAEENPAACKEGLVLLAPRYLSSENRDERTTAAALLVPIAGDRRAYAMIKKALDQDASGIAESAAEILRAVRDPAQLPPLQKLYRELVPPKTGGRQGSQGRKAPNKRRGKKQGRRGGDRSRPQPARSGAGLAKASQEEKDQLAEAVIEAFGAIGGAEAAKALRSIAYVEKRDEFRRLIVKALEGTNTPESVAHLVKFVSTTDPLALEALQALETVARLDPKAAKSKLEGIVRSAQTRYELVAAAADALDGLKGAGD